MTWSEPGAVEERSDRRSGVGPENECFGQLTAHVDQVLLEGVLHPVRPPMRSGVVLQLGDDDVRITAAVFTRTVVREHRTASLMGCTVTPRLQHPVQLLVPGRVFRVQTNLDANNTRGERPQKYDHHLKDTLYCACGAKLMVERTYQRNSLPQTQAEHVRKVLNDVFDQLEGSSEDERKRLTAQRDKLEAERLKLIQAHYADAIPLDLLKSEQDRIRASLDQITTQLDNLTDTYAKARTGLDQLTELLIDLDDLYNKCEPAERRILNRALFTRITIDDEENATYTPEQTTASVLAHTSIDAPAHVAAETKLPRHQAGQVSIFSSYVELRGIEPLTFSLRTKRSTN